MSWKNALLSLFCICTTHNVYAFFCPNNFNSINVGYTQQQVDEACGRPPTVTETERQPEDNSPQEWTYLIKQTSIFDTDVPGTIKATIAFDDKGRVVNMTINGMSVGTGTVCGNTVQIGTMRDVVQKSCGKPAYVSKAQNTGPAPAPKKLVVYQYASTPPVSLIFEGGILVERK